VFVVVAFVEPFTMGSNLPRERGAIFGPGITSLWVLYAEQMLLLCTLICAAFMWFDGSRPPQRLFIPIGLIALFAPLIDPEIRPEQLTDTIGGFPPRMAVAIESVLALLMATAVGSVISYLNYSDSDNRTWQSLTPGILEIAVCALVFGAPAAARILALTATMQLIAKVLSRVVPFLQWIPWTGFLVVASILQLAFWHDIATSSDRLLGSWGALLLAIVATIALSVLSRLVARAEFARAPGWNRNWPVLRSPTMMKPEDRPAAIDAIIKSPSYKLAELDTNFLQRSELRPVRMQLELLKPEMTLAENGVHSTIVAFGGTQIVNREEAQRRLAKVEAALAESPEDPLLKREVFRQQRLLEKSRYYDDAREFARLVSHECQHGKDREFVIITGGGPGIMEAANRGAHDVGAKSIGLNITLPEEQFPNAYITPELCFQFHYFALRKMHFVLRAKALVVFPGGFGTLDELFEVLTLRQTKRMQAIPVILFGRDYWSRVFDFQFLADEGVIADHHLQLIEYAETPEEAWNLICQFHGIKR
jgi:uncharacterized protein (TIGR00730 family)